MLLPRYLQEHVLKVSHLILFMSFSMWSLPHKDSSAVAKTFGCKFLRLDFGGRSCGGEALPKSTISIISSAACEDFPILNCGNWSLI